ALGALATRHSIQQVPVEPFRREQDRETLPDRLGVAISEDAGRSAGPRCDRPIARRDPDGIVRRFHARRQPVEGFAHAGPLANALIIVKARRSGNSNGAGTMKVNKARAPPPGCARASRPASRSAVRYSALTGTVVPLAPGVLGSITVRTPFLNFAST